MGPAIIELFRLHGAAVIADETDLVGQAIPFTGGWAE